MCKPCHCRAPPEIEKILVESTIADLGLGFAKLPYAEDVSHGEVELFCARAGHITGR